MAHIRRAHTGGSAASMLYIATFQRMPSLAWSHRRGVSCSGRSDCAVDVGAWRALRSAGVPLTTLGKTIEVDLFLDFICPFSTRMFKAVDTLLNTDVAQKVSFKVHHVVQPWHPQGTCVHEAALAVSMTAPDAYKPFIREVISAFDAGKFKDEDTWNKSRADIYSDLLKLVVEASDEKTGQHVQGMLAMKEGGCNEMTQHIKWATKFHRARGVHVTPTVYVNGLEAGIVSSGWSAEQWKSFLEPMGADNFQGKSKISACSSRCESSTKRDEDGI
eukprot:6203334-Pleurochrysis_carterae.AAC.4